MGERTDNLRRLMNLGRELVTEHDPDTVLLRLLEQARAVTGARSVALGILNEQRTALERLLHLGIDDATVRAISELPRGRGVLGVPILVRGEAWGKLYLAEKENGEPFNEADEEAAMILADWAATAVDNARVYTASEERRTELEQAVRRLDAGRTIADAIGAEADLDRILELIANRGCALIASRVLLILLRRGDELVISACAGEVEDATGRSMALANSTSGDVLRDGRGVRIAADQLRSATEAVGVRGADNAMFVPMTHQGEGLGVLIAFDRGPEREPFTDADEDLLHTFAASAAHAVAISRSAEADRLRATMAAAEAERRRWARELHDETLQALGALRVLLAGALRRDNIEGTRETMIQALSDIEHEIENLRSIITELRPLLLDDLGLGPAIEALIDRRRAGGLEITAALELGGKAGPAVLILEHATTIYRLVQEALTNVVKHAQASQVSIGVGISGQAAVVTVGDDGVGFDTTERVAGFGLAGIRERVYLARGTLEIVSAPGSGTTMRATLPLSGCELLTDEALPEGRLAHGLGSAPAELGLQCFESLPTSP